MQIETIRQYCLSFPQATEDIQWENDLLFRIGGKIFTGVSLTPADECRYSFKCTPAEFAELIERNGIVPAPYVARYHWVSVQRDDALTAAEFRRLIRNSYDMVSAKLPAKIRKQLKLA
jgi:predicted DNA-binding protein (MmcQ/YjbR family)